MAKVKIRTLVGIAGADFSLAGGDIWEVDEAVAKARVAAGLAEWVDEPETRPTQKRGAKTAESAVTPKPEQRTTKDDASS